ncbi:hypothetical protein GCM10023219_09010 [Stakelama sediminis]|uniref:DUF2093 domain-containing protein n=1 Tax=Stakelama sediminis TaxID=463200 RepID=A0A840YVF4_9SPHN|nr:DUF2093 domain-containing protein [Stakelama sediminis]MBB5717623.1 hypothetical protein [Stakelama sediminis]
MLMSNRSRTARLHYLANGFRVLSPGDHVLCAISGEAIPLDDLRYWDVRSQQAYATAEIATKALLDQ